MAAAKSKVEYLKRYGYKPEDSSSKKKTKRVKKILQGTVIPKSKIVDDDIDIKAVAPADNDDNDLETGEEAPQIAGFVDERPVDLQKMELFASNKWRVLGMDDNVDTEVKTLENRGYGRQRHGSNSDHSLKNHRVRHDSDSDRDSNGLSPPTKVRHDSDASPPRRKIQQDTDASPPRQRSRHDSDASPPRRKTQQDSDTSPPRRKSRQDSDNSPPRQKIPRSYNSSPKNKGRHGRDSSDSPRLRSSGQDESDSSPPRRKSHSSTYVHVHKGRNNSRVSTSRQQKRRDSDDSSPRRKLQDDSDTSPPRKTKHSSTLVSRCKNGQDSDMPNRKHKVRDNAEFSPPRHKPDSAPQRSKIRRTYNSSPRQKSRSDSDTSPPRRKARIDVNNSSARRNTKRDSDTLLSRHKKGQDSDTSPPKHKIPRSAGSNTSSTQSNEQSSQNRRIHANVASDYFPSRKNNSDSDRDSSPTRKPSESRTLQKKTLDGKKAGLQDSKTLKTENRRANERERLFYEKMDEEVSGRNAKTILRDRSTGMRRDLEEEKRKQMEEDAIKAEREAKYNQWGKGVKQTEMQKSRLEQDLREMSKPLARYGDDEDLDKALRDQDRDGDPMLAFIKKKKATKIGGKELPKYNGPQPPPNRFGIMPGYRWDGVDRSNGFEKALFSRRTSKVAAEEEAYKWSVEDM